jgi:quaternary ammonium compound-resistance protein SugE
MAWAMLVLAGLMEIGFTTALRFSEGFTRLLPTLLFALFAGLSFYLLERAAREIPLGTAYAVWTGIGAAGTVLAGAVLFGEPLSLIRFFFLAMLVGSIIGLRLVS